MVLITIHQYFKKSVGAFTRAIMTIWSLSLFLISIIAINQVDKTEKRFQSTPGFQSSIKYQTASNMFKMAKKNNDIASADSALKVSKDALKLSDLNKQKMIQAANKEHKKYQNLVNNIEIFIKNNAGKKHNKIINKNNKIKALK